MVNCKFCNEQNLEWYQRIDEKWKLGIKLDINNFRQHRCSPPQTQESKSNKRNWVDFICEKCHSKTKQNVKIIKPKELNLCLECDNQW